MFNQPLSNEQLQKLNEHKYSSSGRSVIEPLFQVFWNWLIEKCPMWFAPNAMTLLGLALNVSSVIFILYESPNGKNNNRYCPPCWHEVLSQLHCISFVFLELVLTFSQISPLLLVLASICLFIYQTLDALDGKQARRTQSSSPLGELFDHGCDSFSTVFISLGNCVAVGMGTHPILMFIEVILSVSLFYMAQWQCYVIGSIQFGRVDVTEAQLAVMIIYLVTAVFGLDFWSRKIPILGLQYKEVQFIVMILPAMLMFIRFVTTIMRGGVGKNGATVANTSVVFPVCPLLLVVFFATAIAIRSPTQLYYNYPCVYLMSFGLVTAKISNKVVVAHMTKSEISVLDMVLIGPISLFLNQYFNCPLDELCVLLACCIWTTWDSIKYAVLVCAQISNFLNLYVFRTDKPPSTQQLGRKHK